MEACGITEEELQETKEKLYTAMKSSGKLSEAAEELENSLTKKQLAILLVKSIEAGMEMTAKILVDSKLAKLGES